MSVGVNSFDCRTRKETSIEEWHATKSFRALGAIHRTRVQRPKEKRSEHARVILSPGHHAVSELIGEKCVIAIEPSFGFQKREEEQSREAKQREISRC